MVWQNSGLFSEVDPAMLLAVKASTPQGIDPVGSVASTRKKKRRAAGAMVKKFNGKLFSLVSH